MNWRAALAALLLAAGATGAGAVVSTQAGEPMAGLAGTQPDLGARQVVAVPQGEPESGGTLEDPDFGVRTDQFGLDRRVEMYQWFRGAEGGYRQVWKPALVDSSGFEPGHENPPAFPLESRRWWAARPTLDGKPLDQAVLKTLGQWQEFRPGFSRLPGNLAATFQPEGDGLGSSENPLDPQVGDLRIRWRELHLPPLAGRVELDDGRWHLSASAAQAALNAQPLPPVPEDDVFGSGDGVPTWVLAAVTAIVLAAICLVLLGLALRRRRN